MGTGPDGAVEWKPNGSEGCRPRMLAKAVVHVGGEQEW